MSRKQYIALVSWAYHKTTLESTTHIVIRVHMHTAAEFRKDNSESYLKNIY